MPERGSRVALPRLVRYALQGAEYFTWPLRLDDYLELISPLWSVTELRGRIERIARETDDAVTVSITPGFRWPGHAPGQHVRIGFDISGQRHWRAYSLTSDRARPDGRISITVKRTADGVVSRWLHGSQANGSIVTLGEVEGEFTLPSRLPPKLLFVTAGSGITPIIAMLRSLARTPDAADLDIVHVHSARTAEDAIFAGELGELARRRAGYHLTIRLTGEQGRLTPDQLDDLCADWRDREAYACGPGPMLDALRDHFDEAGVPERLHVESFEGLVIGAPAGRGGTIRFAESETTVECDGTTPILAAGESADLALAYGCRMGICHTCVGRLADGAVRDLRTGEITLAGSEVRVCVNCPEGPIRIEL